MDATFWTRLLFFCLSAAVSTVNGNLPAAGDINLCPLSGLGIEGESSQLQGQQHSGMLEVFTEFGWSAVNSFGFGGVAAQVVCAQLGFAFISNVTALTAASRKPDVIISKVTCHGNETNLSQCSLEVSEDPSDSDLSLVYITCDSRRNTTNGLILFFIDSPSFTTMNYPEVNITTHSTYSFIEPSQNIYKGGCVTERCTVGGHFYTLGTTDFEDFFLPDLRDQTCDPTTGEVGLTLIDTEFLSQTPDCNFMATNELVIGSEVEFCSISTDSSALMVKSASSICLFIIGLVY